MRSADIERLRALMEFEASRLEPPASFPELPPLPGGRYTAPEFFQQETGALFGKSWLLAAHMDELPEPGAFLRWENAGRPVVLVRGDRGEINALINRCSHRGAPVVMESQGRSSRLTCTYHGWSYGHDGELLGVREARDFRNLDRACLGLARLRCERFGQLIFVNFDTQAEPLLDYLGPLAEEWREFRFESCRLSRRDRFTVACNWKLAMEANLEVYHVPSIHGRTVAPVLDARRNVNTLYRGGHGRMVAPIPAAHEPRMWESPWSENPEVGEIGRSCTQSYNVFPNMVVPLNQFVIPPIQFWPAGPERCVIETWTLAPDWGGERSAGPDMWTEDSGQRPVRVLREDIEMAEAIQAGLGTLPAPEGTLGYQEARIYHWHQCADAVIGPQNIAPALRVEPVLGEDWMYPNDPRLARLE